MFIWIYRFTFLPVFLLLFSFNLPKLIRRGRFWESFGQRLGFYRGLYAKRNGKRRLWLQVVSVGEAQAAISLIQALDARPDCELCITTTTSTAYALLRQRFEHCSEIWIGYFPYDFYPLIARAWRHVNPDLVVLFESELWPEFLHQSWANRVPVWVVNARHSDSTMTWFSRLPMVARWLYAYVTKAMFVSRVQVDNLQLMAIVPHETKVLGQLKFDVSLPDVSQNERSALFQSMGFVNLSEDACVIIGASTWPGEELILLEALQMLRAKDYDVRLILVPRHAERGARIAKLVASAGCSYTLRSRGSTHDDVLVHIADTTGEMQKLCQCADIGVVGKSFLPHQGGQTPIELAAAGVPMVYGPSMTNFREVCDDLEMQNLSKQCHSSDEAIQRLSELVQDAQMRRDLSCRLRQWFHSRKGVLSRVLKEFDDFLNDVG